MTARLVALKGIIAATDTTFTFKEPGPASELVGKCIMCRRKNVGYKFGARFTVEHISIMVAVTP